MSYIIEKLYLGDIDDAFKTAELKEHKGITHILTVDSKPLPVDARQGFSYLHVHAIDSEDFDLLRELDSCVRFIDDARKEGAVLVHCWAGQSRSAAVVVAYVMKVLDLSPSEADKLVRCQRPGIKPNDGFVQQLELFHAMNCHVDPSHPGYRKYRLDILTRHMQKDFRGIEVRCQSNLEVMSISGRVERRLPNCPGGQMSQVRLQDQLPEDCFTADPSTLPSGCHDETVYRCAKCRRPLFRQSGVETHEPCTAPKTQFKGQSHKSSGQKQGSSFVNVCDVFIEPVTWMASMILTIEGKLTCPKCSSKIGSFNWSGEQCPCGSWITPAFHIQRSKVDACRPVAVPGARLPGSAVQPSVSCIQLDTPLTVMTTPDGCGPSCDVRHSQHDVHLNSSEIDIKS